MHFLSFRQHLNAYQFSNIIYCCIQPFFGPTFQSINQTLKDAVAVVESLQIHSCAFYFSNDPFMHAMQQCALMLNNEQT